MSAPPSKPTAGPLEAVSGGTQEGLERAGETPAPRFGKLSTLELEVRRTSFRFSKDTGSGKRRRLYLSLGGKDGDPKGFGKALGKAFQHRDRVTLILTRDLEEIHRIASGRPRAAPPAPPSPDSPSHGERKQQLLGGPAALRLVWYSRNVARASYGMEDDGLFNADCACGATIVGTDLPGMADAEQWHFRQTEEDRAHGHKRYGCGPIEPRCPLGSGTRGPAAGPSSSSSASLESGGGTLETMGAVTRDTTTPEGR